MAFVAQWVSGDESGVSSPFLDVDVQLPDALGNLTVAGVYVPQGSSVGTGSVSFGGTVACLTPTGAGTQFLMIEVNTSSGALTGKTSTTTMPAPDAGTVAIFQQTIPSTVGSNTVPSKQGGWTFPTQW